MTQNHEQLTYFDAADRGDLLAATVLEALNRWTAETVPPELQVAAIDPDLADTAAFCERYGFAMEDSANCVIVAGKRGDDIRYAACMVLATTRADVNGFVRRRLDARKASFAPVDGAVSLTGMEFGGITPVGLPPEWPILIDSRVIERDRICIGSGVRKSKLFLPGRALLALPGAELSPGLTG